MRNRKLTQPQIAELAALYHCWEEEPRIRALTKEIVAILNGELAEKLKELFEGVYGGRCDEEYTEILGALVTIEQETLPCAEMLFKGIGE